MDNFLDGYKAAIAFTEMNSDSELAELSFSDMAEETIKAIEDDCAKFQEVFGKLLEKAYEKDSYDSYQAGIAFWFTRNHHGAGFWDRGLGVIGEELTEASHSFKSVDFYIGDDNLIYFG